jgi:hypothetical protein
MTPPAERRNVPQALKRGRLENHEDGLEISDAGLKS